MIQRIKLSDRVLPTYGPAEELTNTVTHIFGCVLSLLALILCVEKSARLHSPIEITAAAIYGSCLILLYAFSSIYHGLKPSMAKKVMQVFDHCAIYFLIAGSYTVVSLSAIRWENPALGWGLFAVEWALCTVATVLTAIDLKRYRVFSMICYIGMGWAIIPLAPMLMEILSPNGFGLLLAGGIVYTVGAVLYGLGKKIPWMHAAFHVLVVAGSILQFVAFYQYAL